jgi:predicted nuclease of predicted toxin-antitoxin system
LVDNQLPAALARFLASRGVECQHVLDLDLAESTDFTLNSEVRHRMEFLAAD